MTDSPAQTIADAALEEWHRIVTQRDWEKLEALAVDGLEYHTPAQLEPLRGKEAITNVLRLVFGIFEDFEYLRRFDGNEGKALEFRARVGEHQLFGIDLVRFNDAGKMTELVVMLRPAEAVAELGKEAARRMGNAVG